MSTTSARKSTSGLGNGTCHHGVHRRHPASTASINLRANSYDDIVRSAAISENYDQADHRDGYFTADPRGNIWVKNGRVIGRPRHDGPPLGRDHVAHPQGRQLANHGLLALG